MRVMTRNDTLLNYICVFIAVQQGATLRSLLPQGATTHVAARLRPWLSRFIYYDILSGYIWYYYLFCVVMLGKNLTANLYVILVYHNCLCT